MLRLKMTPLAFLGGFILAGSLAFATSGDEKTLPASQHETKLRVEANLVKAKEKLREKVEKARAPILEKIEERDVLARKKGDIPLVDKIKVEREEFLDKGIIPDKKLAGDYAKAIEMAKTELLNAYDSAIRELLIGRLDDESKAIKAQREKLKGDRAVLFNLIRESKGAAVEEPTPVAAPAPAVAPPPARVSAIDLHPIERALLPKDHPLLAIPPVHDIDLMNRPLRRDFRVLNGSWFLDGQDLIETERNGDNALLIGDVWDNYDFQCRALMMEGDKGIGLLLHYTDKANHNRVLLGTNKGKTITVEMYKNAERTVLKEIPLKQPFQRMQWYDLQVKVRGPEITVNVNGREIFKQLDNAFKSGRAGFSSPWDTIPRFRDIEILSADGLTDFRGLPYLRRW